MKMIDEEKKRQSFTWVSWNALIFGGKYSRRLMPCKRLAFTNRPSNILLSKCAISL